MNNYQNGGSGQDRTGQDRTGQDRTGQDRTGSEFNIPIFAKIYDFYKLLYQYLKFFPKKDRYSLGQKLDNLTLEIFELVIMAGSAIGEKKLPLLEKSITSVDLLKILIRLAKDIQALDNKKYLQLESSLQEIGRMLGGWRKFLKDKTLPQNGHPSSDSDSADSSCC
ncbi:MAG: diversity-generating retroelement protein Avd [Candidatus Daviesbacteria bacterium]|nr:diversity-generating retroelement protein Avd [Candidatus Daviesbacteria bacterium]